MAAHSKPLSARPHTCARASVAAPRWLTFLRVRAPPDRVCRPGAVARPLAARSPARVTPCPSFRLCYAGFRYSFFKKSLLMCAVWENPLYLEMCSRK